MRIYITSFAVCPFDIVIFSIKIILDIKSISSLFKLAKSSRNIQSLFQTDCAVIYIFSIFLL